MLPLPDPGKWMDRKPEEGNARVKHTRHPGDEQQLCLHELIVSALPLRHLLICFAIAMIMVAYCASGSVYSKS